MYTKETQPILFNSRTVGYEWLSNFYVCPFTAGTNIKITYPSVEHYYQCNKLNYLQPALSTSAYYNLIQEMTAMPSAIVRRYAKQFTPRLRLQWYTYRRDVMQLALEAKFTNPELRTKLVRTHPRRLYHFSPWDLYWGVNDANQGENVLGILIMELRQTLYTNDRFQTLIDQSRQETIEGK